MKRYKNLYFMPILASLLLSIAACQPDEVGEIMTPLSRMDGIVGSWKVEMLEQLDETAKKAGEADYSLNLTNQFGFDAIEFSFTENQYSISNQEGAPMFIPTEGFWSFDDPDYPTTLILTGSADGEAVGELALNRVPTPGHKLEVKFQRKDEEGVPYLSYLFILNRVYE